MWNMWTNSMHDILARIAYVCISWKSKKNEFYYSKNCPGSWECDIWTKGKSTIIQMWRLYQYNCIESPYKTCSDQKKHKKREAKEGLTPSLSVYNRKWQINLCFKWGKSISRSTWNFMWKESLDYHTYKVHGVQTEN